MRKNPPATDHAQCTLAAELLEDILPQIQAYTGQTIVVALSDALLLDQPALLKLLQNVIHLRQVGVYPVVVHDGLSLVQSSLDTVATPSLFPPLAQGIPYARQQQLDRIEMVLSAHINPYLVALCQQLGGKAVGISGRDGNLIEAKKLRRSKRVADSNIESLMESFVEGEPTLINPDILVVLEETDFIPFVAPLGTNEKNELFHLCPYQCASMISSALVSEKLMIFAEDTFFDSVDIPPQAPIAKVLHVLGHEDTPQTSKNILQACLDAIHHHTGEASIIRSSQPNMLLLELFHLTDQNITIGHGM